MRFDLCTSSFIASERDAAALAVQGSDHALSWQELKDQACAWAKRARAAGIDRDVPVVIHGHKEAAFFVAMTACLMIGAPFVPVDRIYPEERVRRITSIVGAPFIYDTAADRFGPGAGPARAMAEKNLAYVIFTSGSTGDPKGVQIGRESVILLAEWMMRDFGLGPAPVFMNQAPFSFDLSMYEVFGTLACGGSCILSARDRIASGGPWLEGLAEQNISVWVSTPSFAHQQLIQPTFTGQSLPTLTTFLFCGEPLTRALAQKLRSRFPNALIQNTYGPTEATVATTNITIDDAIIAAHPSLPIGFAKRDALVWIDDGELCIVGDHVMRGYLNRPDLNQSRMFVHSDGRRGFRTGDLGERDNTGLLFCRGRMDDQIKLNGYRMELTEIDAALSGLPGVNGGACAALRRPDGAVARLVGFVEIAGVSGALPVSLADWKQSLGVHLPAYMIPSELIACESLPMSNNHKVDRKRLLEIYTQNPNH